MLLFSLSQNRTPAYMHSSNKNLKFIIRQVNYALSLLPTYLQLHIKQFSFSLLVPIHWNHFLFVWLMGCWVKSKQAQPMRRELERGTQLLSSSLFLSSVLKLHHKG